ncbi:NlpC/P60 family protein [Lentilactobacillus parafarraginis]|uniref:NlpC/P60 family protein n=1 Tax=Lentilactobacillus parafarraginis TaxID=390842 RepID=UPI001CDB3432
MELAESLGKQEIETRCLSSSATRRSDLLLLTGDHVIWHVAIYLGANRVIESWPPRIMVQPIRNGQRSDVAGVARVFN